jgi:transcriptional regulator with PAS, ATPase and Fis domain
MRALQTEIRDASASDVNVLVMGESGSGKEVVAHAVHDLSQARGQFVAHNCAAIPEGLAEAEIFGHAPKAGIAGADPSGAPGWFEQAHEGTLFLDEIQSLTLGLQDKFLRVLQDKEVWRLRARRPVKVGVKIVAATDRDLRQSVDSGSFRGPFFYRFGKLIRLTPLRERKDDIPLLAFYFLDTYAARIGALTRTLSRRALTALSAYDWPGNVRELESAVRSAVERAHDRIVLFSWDFPELINDAPSSAATDLEAHDEPASGAIKKGPRQMKDVEKEKIMEALETCRGNKTKAAELLGYKSRQTILTKMDRFGIPRRFGDPDALGEPRREKPNG